MKINKSTMAGSKMLENIDLTKSLSTRVWRGVNLSTSSEYTSPYRGKGKKKPKPKISKKSKKMKTSVRPNAAGPSCIIQEWYTERVHCIEAKWTQSSQFLDVTVLINFKSSRTAVTQNKNLITLIKIFTSPHIMTFYQVST